MEILEERQEIGVGPVGVVEHHDGGTAPGERPDHRADRGPRIERGADRAGAMETQDRLELRLQHGAGGVAQLVANEAAHPLTGAFARHAGPDPERLAHRLGKAGEGQPLAVGVAGAEEDEGTGQAGPQLLGEAGLADAGLVDDDLDASPSARPHRLRLGGQAAQDGDAVDERARAGAAAPDRRSGRPGAQRLVGRDRLGLAPGGEDTPRAVADRVGGERPRGVPDQHLPGRGEVGQPGGHVDRVPHHGEAGRFARPGDHDLPRVDPDVQARERDAGPPGLQLTGPPGEGEGRADRAVGIVLVGGGNAEDGHEPVAHDLRHGPAVVLDDQSQGRHPRPDDRVDLLRIKRGGEGGVAGQVGEEERHELPLRPDDRLAARGAAETGGGKRAAAGVAKDRLDRRRPGRAAGRSAAWAHMRPGASPLAVTGRPGRPARGCR